MGNPALELAELLDAWRGSSATPVEVRGGEHPGDSAFWRGQGRAVALLDEIDLSLQALGSVIDVTHYEPFVAEWYRTVFSFNTAWNSRGTVAAIEPAALSMLMALGGVLALAPPRDPLTATTRGTLLECVRDAVAFLEVEGDSLAPTEKVYVLRLLESVRKLLEERAILGVVDLQSLIDQMTGALLGLAAQFQAVDGDGKRAGKLRQVIGRIVSLTRAGLNGAGSVASITSGVIDVLKELPEA